MKEPSIETEITIDELLGAAFTALSADHPLLARLLHIAKKKLRERVATVNIFSPISGQIEERGIDGVVNLAEHLCDAFAEAPHALDCPSITGDEPCRCWRTHAEAGLRRTFGAVPIVPPERLVAIARELSPPPVHRPIGEEPPPPPTSADEPPVISAPAPSDEEPPMPVDIGAELCTCGHRRDMHAVGAEGTCLETSPDVCACASFELPIRTAQANARASAAADDDEIPF